MNSNQNAFLQMCAAVKATADAHVNAWTSFAPFSSAYTPYLTLLAQTDDAIALQEKSSTGTTEGKALIRKNLTDKLMQLGDSLALYAQVINDAQLLSDAPMVRSTMEGLKEKELLGHAHKLQALVAPTAIATAVTAYPNNTTLIADTGVQVAKFTSAIGTPRHIAVESMRGTEELERIITQLRAKLEQMDVAARVLQYSQLAFYSEYINSRAIIDANTTTRALTVTVKDNNNGELLENATAVFNPSNEIKSTGPQGMFYVQSMAAGNYTMTVSKPGYTEQSVPFTMDTFGGIQLVVNLES
jgi:hypothetical protein